MRANDSCGSEASTHGAPTEASRRPRSEYLGDLLSSFRGMVMFSGGGNIGIYPDYGEVRAAVIAQTGPRHRCLVFPQSALRPEPALVDPRVTVWCRDAVSQKLLQQAGTPTAALVPDIALYMDDVIAKRPHGEGAFYIKRRPGGDAETIDHNIHPDCASADLTFAQPLKEIVAQLTPYEIVISDRLHGGLIALMMRKKVIFLPVGYHKIQAFYDTWLHAEPGAAFATTQQELITKLRALQPPSCDLAGLFCEYADPAFNRFLLGA